MTKNLLQKLINDEKKVNKKLYTAGSYWDYKNSRAAHQIIKKGIKNFRGVNVAIGSSFADSVVLDIRNELNTFGRIAGSLFSLPFLKRIFNRQLIVTNRHIQQNLKNLSIVYQNNADVLSLLKKYKFENTTDFGCIKKMNLENKEYSIHYLNMADRIDQLSNKFDFKVINSFFEIGGGFGSNIHFMLTNFPQIRKIIYLDIVPNIYIGTEYLRHHYGKNVKDYLNYSNEKKISFSKDNNLEVICIPPWEIEKLDVEIDHFHNAASFVEMPEHVIKNYCKYIKKFNTKHISLVSYDKYNLETTLKPELLNSFFDNSLNVEWKDVLIKDYKRKYIYLTSS
jgi:putative sugar O-methyltransferase